MGRVCSLLMSMISRRERWEWREWRLSVVVAGTVVVVMVSLVVGGGFVDDCGGG